MTPSPSPHELDALAPLVESAYEDSRPIPEEAFLTRDPDGEEILVIPLANYEAAQVATANWIMQARDEATAGERWQRRAIRAEQIAGFFGVVLAIIAFAQMFRFLEGLWK